MTMTSESESAPYTEGSEPPPRPSSVTTAVRLWIWLGVLLILATLFVLGSPQSNLSTGPAAPLIVFGAGVAFILLARLMGRGNRNARTALTVLGCVLLIGIWTALFVVPALILQFRPRSSAWFEAIGAQPGTP
jgi:hypothetical protein